VSARRILAAACLQSGRHAEALQELEAAALVSPDNPVVLAWLAHGRAVTGDRDAAADLVARIGALARRRYVPAYHLALAHAGMGSHDAAFAALDRAFSDRDPVLANVAIEPRFAPLRSDKRHRQLLERLHLHTQS
jgi:Flp pilus assembly protein TadD